IMANPIAVANLQVLLSVRLGASLDGTDRVLGELLAGNDESLNLVHLVIVDEIPQVGRELVRSLVARGVNPVEIRFALCRFSALPHSSLPLLQWSRGGGGEEREEVSSRGRPSNCELSYSYAHRLTMERGGSGGRATLSDRAIDRSSLCPSLPLEWSVVARPSPFLVSCWPRCYPDSGQELMYSKRFHPLQRRFIPVPPLS
ncbi:hypothetical protein PMAYCL1PPCAC_21150, partial [Pristionchus mayeri]